MCRYFRHRRRGGLIACWALTLALAPWFIRPAAAAHPDFILTKLIPGELTLYDDAELERLIETFSRAGLNTVSVIVAWSTVEPAPGRFDFSAYEQRLDRLTEAGFRLLLILDSSGRPLLDTAVRLTGERALPEWMKNQFDPSLSRDFTGNQGINLDYHDSRHLPPLENFYRRTVAELGGRYGPKVLAFAPGIMHELELKYAQQGYRWQSYSEHAQRGFDDWLKRRGLPPAPMPVIDYANQTGQGFPTYQPLYGELMRFREHTLREYVCRLTGLIREQDFAAAGYFGQVLSAHDAIYALGIIEQLVDCLDTVTVDYNYYDGWNVELNPYIIPLLVNYAHNLGYREVLAGLYLEWLYGPHGQFLHDPQPLVGRTVELLGRQRPPAGVEIGNIRLPDLDQLRSFGLRRLSASAGPARTAPFTVGLVASVWTYYLWVGEHWHERNIVQDALLESYRLLLESPDFEVQVLGEQALLNQDLGRFDALFLPHQTTLSPAAVDALLRYHAGGGRLAQDLRFGAFEISGAPTHDWHNALFGIAGVEWRNDDALFVSRLGPRPRRVRLPAQGRSYFGHARLAAQPGYRLLMSDFYHPGTGLMVRGPRTLAFGFLPQLAEDKRKPGYWQELFLAGLRQLIEGSSAAGAQPAQAAVQPAPQPAAP